MALIKLDLPVYEGGRSLITLNFCAKRSGSNNDNVCLRIKRTMAGQTDVILPGDPDFILPADKDARGWVWVDPQLPATGTATYTLQIKRIDGGGNFYEMMLNGIHYNR